MRRQRHKNLFERLISHCVRGEPHGCWLWTGWMEKNGRGKLTLRINGAPRSRWAYRVMYELVNGPIPPGMTLDHALERCSGKRCIRPDHMEVVPRMENIRRHFVRQREKATASESAASLTRAA